MEQRETKNRKTLKSESPPELLNNNSSEPLRNILLTEAQTCNRPLSALIYNSEVNTDCVQWLQKNDSIHM